MKDKKRIEIPLKVIERIYSKSPGMQTLIEESMIDICKEKSVSLEQVFFAFLWLSEHKFFIVIKKKIT